MATTNFEKMTANQARGYASLVTRLAKGFSESNRVRETIHSNVEIGKGKHIIRIRAGGPNAPDARAREFGSGVWARRGPKGKILIRARNYPYLTFKWDVATSPVSSGAVNIPKNKEGYVHLKQVEHPGIDADNDGKGYIGPAIRETNRLMRKRFVEEGKKAIRLDIRASFKRAKS
jgi:hypothetical protein